MEDQFDIKFECDGVLYEGQVWRCEEDEDCYYQVTYHQSDTPHNSKIILLENSEIGKWVQKKEGDVADVSLDFIEAMAKQVETHYTP
jgi:hypothetical protein